MISENTQISMNSTAKATRVHDVIGQMRNEFYAQSRGTEYYDVLIFPRGYTLRRIIWKFVSEGCRKLESD